MNSQTLAEAVQDWARSEPSIEALWLIGSQVRTREDAVWKADPQSDWDFQVIASDPERFSTAAWTHALGYDLRAYSVRRAAISGLPKVAALFAGADADFVVLPASKLKLARWAVRWGLHRRIAGLGRSLQDLAVVVRPGWRFLKGRARWQPFLERVVADIADPRMNDAEVRNLADGFVCDAVWTRRKIARGEFLAAQRMLHRSLGETNLRLLHELKLRRGERSFPEGRRAERILDADELSGVCVAALPDRDSLIEAVGRSAETCRRLVGDLIGGSWRWPDDCAPSAIMTGLQAAFEGPPDAARYRD